MTKFEAFLNNHHYTTCGLAKLTGLSKSQVSEYRRDLHRPNRQTARRIAIALQMSIDTLLQEIPIRERTENRPRKVAYCVTCHRRLWKLPPNWEENNPVEQTVQAA